jgi:hypothetical protein
MRHCAALKQQSSKVKDNSDCAEGLGIWHCEGGGCAGEGKEGVHGLVNFLVELICGDDFGVRAVEAEKQCSSDVNVLVLPICSTRAGSLVD